MSLLSSICHYHIYLLYVKQFLKLDLKTIYALKLKMIQVYLSECDTWSDADDFHEEDHNLYYDTKFFYIINEPDYKVVFMWNIYYDTIDKGFVSEWSNSMHINKLDNCQPCETISKEIVIELMNKELERLRERSALFDLLDITEDAFGKHPRELCAKVEHALLTF